MVRGEISVASYNCNGLADYKKIRSVFILRCVEKGMWWQCVSVMDKGTPKV
jgi:hypothetical protein